MNGLKRTLISAMSIIGSRDRINLAPISFGIVYVVWMILHKNLRKRIAKSKNKMSTASHLANLTAHKF